MGSCSNTCSLQSLVTKFEIIFMLWKLLSLSLDRFLDYIRWPVPSGPYLISGNGGKGKEGLSIGKDVKFKGL